MRTKATPTDTRSEPRSGRRMVAGLLPIGVTEGCARFSLVFRLRVYNKQQLSLIHKRLKVGIANQRHPLTSSDSSQHNPKKQE
jgi:hypothetical protein